MGKLKFLKDFKIWLNNTRISLVKRSRLRNVWGALNANHELENIHKGKRCFVIGNAPSLNTQDLRVLKDEIVLTVNQISRNKQFKSLNTNYHFWADPGFFKENSKEGDKELLEVMMSVNTEGNRPICFFPLEAKEFVSKKKLDQILNVRYFVPGHILFDQYKKIDFSGMIPGMNTVVQYAIMLGIYMGCTEIYLLGCDCTGILSYIETKTDSGNFEYAYDISQAEAERMKAMLGGVSCEQTFYGWAKIFEGYRLLGEYCKQKGVQFINVTNGGILDCLPRKKFENVVK